MELALLSLLVFAIWSTAWKGWALWRAAQKKSIQWFVVLLILNVGGILEIIYTLIVDRETADRKYSQAVGAIVVSLALIWAVLVNLPQLPA
jgi:hypothetical protein